jgi:hypothetical protein
LAALSKIVCALNVAKDAMLKMNIKNRMSEIFVVKDSNSLKMLN